MAAHFLGESLEFRGEDGVGVLGQHLVHGFAAIDLFRAHGMGIDLFTLLEFTEAEDGDGVLGGVTVGADDLIHTAVGAGSHHVMFDEDGLSFFSADEGGSLVAGRESGVGLIIEFLGHLGAVERFRVHGDEGLHAVAAVEVHDLGHRAEAVRGIQVAPVLLVLLQAPVAGVGLPEGIQVVLVGTLGVDGFADGAGLDHREGGHLEEVIAAVLEHDAVTAGALGRVHEGPDVLQGTGGRYLDGGVLAVFHSVEGHGNMVAPVGAHIDDVQVLLFTEGLPGLVRSGIFLRGGKSLVGEEFLAGGDPLGQDVAQGGDHDTGHIGQALHGVAAAHAQAHDAHADRLQRFGGEAEDILLSGRTHGHVGLEDSLYGFVVARDRKQGRCNA